MITLPRQLRLVFDVESDDGPRLLGVYEGERYGAVFYVDALGDSCDAPEDCVTVATYDAAAAIGPAPVSFAQAAESATSIVRDDDAIDGLRRNSSPVPGRDGVRVDRDGRVWYSAQWLGLTA